MIWRGEAELLQLGGQHCQALGRGQADPGFGEDEGQVTQEPIVIPGPNNEPARPGTAYCRALIPVVQWPHEDRLFRS